MLIPLEAALFAYAAFLTSGALNSPIARSAVLTWILLPAVLLLPFVVAALVFGRVTLWVRRRDVARGSVLVAHVVRCGFIYLTLFAVLRGLYLQTQTDVLWPWTAFLQMSLPALGGALCGIILTERRAVARFRCAA